MSIKHYFLFSILVSMLSYSLSAQEGERDQFPFTDEMQPDVVREGGASEEYNPNMPPNSYTSKNNPYYWKNKMPKAGYWQQDVDYTINATLDDNTHAIDGSLNLVYTNNSPDELNEVYFHLYQNAFQPESHYDNLQKNNNILTKYGLYEQLGLGTVVKQLTDGSGQDLTFEIHNTIMVVKLKEPIKPGQRMVFNIDFKTFFDSGNVRRRMKMYEHNGVKHFNGVHWYPRIAVYDRKFGWNTNQHLGREFYGNFGKFDVTLNLPKEYIVEATGTLINRNIALPPELREMVDLYNQNEQTEQMLEEYFQGQAGDEPNKSWRFYAENVHDFAFTADPTYRIGEAEWKGVKVIAVVKAENASRWQNTPIFTANVIKSFSEGFGDYIWPKIVVADARDGMEYPMLALCGGSDPSNRYLIAHEVGHNWFQGMIGSNETYRAAMDEGFTQFLTVWALDDIQGPYFATPRYRNNYINRFSDSFTNREAYLYNRYVEEALKEDWPPLNTHSDDFSGAVRHGGGYGQVYYKWGSMLYHLQYVLGDELFQEAMQHYVKTWKVAHPYIEDFRQAIIDYTKADLNWFFDQWIDTQKKIDYRIQNVKRNKGEGTYTITFERREEMQMPLDFTVYTNGGDELKFHIPNTFFVKQTDAEVLPQWTGWGKKLNPTYEATVKIGNDKIEQILIDPTNRLGDVNGPSTRYKNKVDFKFDAQVPSRSNRNQYELKWRPDVWYNSIDGVMAGLHLNGNYMDYKHQFSLTTWFNSQLAQNLDDFVESKEAPNRLPINFNFTYQNALNKVHRNLHSFSNLRVLDGLYRGDIGLKQTYGNTLFYLSARAEIRPDFDDIDYLLYRELWQHDRWNNSIRMGISHDYKRLKGAKGTISADLQTAALGSDYRYSRLTAEATYNKKISKLDLRTRAYAGYIFGDDIAPQSQIFVAGAAPEELMDNKFLRSRAFVPEDWLGYGNNVNHLHYGGGMNLRGYAGYLMPVAAENGDIDFFFAGNGGASVNVELGFDRLVNFKPAGLSRFLKLETYLFADAGVFNTDRDLDLSEVRADAGIGTALTIKRWGPLLEAKPLTIRFDMPFYLSHAPHVAEDNIEFRWLIGISKAF